MSVLCSRILRLDVRREQNPESKRVRRRQIRKQFYFSHYLHVRPSLEPGCFRERRSSFRLLYIFEWRSENHNYIRTVDYTIHDFTHRPRKNTGIDTLKSVRQTPHTPHVPTNNGGSLPSLLLFRRVSDADDGVEREKKYEKNCRTTISSYATSARRRTRRGMRETALIVCARHDDGRGEARIQEKTRRNTPYCRPIITSSKHKIINYEWKKKKNY